LGFPPPPISLFEHSRPFFFFLSTFPPPLSGTPPGCPVHLCGEGRLLQAGLPSLPGSPDFLEVFFPLSSPPPPLIPPPSRLKDKIWRAAPPWRIFFFFPRAFSSFFFVPFMRRELLERGGGRNLPFFVVSSTRAVLSPLIGPV